MWHKWIEAEAEAATEAEALKQRLAAQQAAEESQRCEVCGTVAVKAGNLIAVLSVSAEYHVSGPIALSGAAWGVTPVGSFMSCSLICALEH